MDTAPYTPGGGYWAWCPTEHRTTNLRDAAGKRIGYEIERSLNLRPGDDAPHWRWVSVTKDGYWLRNEWTTSHATWEQAEEAVERRIRRSIARYERLAGKRDVVAASRHAPDDSTPAPSVAISTNATPPQRSRKPQGCLIAIAMAAGVLIAAVRCLATGL